MIESDKVKELIDQAKKYLKQPDGYRLFSSVKMDELQISALLAHIFDPRQLHGMGNKMMLSFLSLLKAKGAVCSEDRSQLEAFVEVCSEQCEILSVVTEYNVIDRRRIDILSTFTSGAQLGIENKPYADDQVEQLVDYGSGIERDSRDHPWLIVYLCNGHPSEKSLPKGSQYASKVVCLSFYALVEWLSYEAKQVKDENVWEFAAMLSGLAKELDLQVNGRSPMSEKMVELLTTYLGDDDDAWEALESVFQHRKQYFIPKVQALFECIDASLNENGWVRVPESEKKGFQKGLPLEEAEKHSGVTYQLKGQDGWVVRLGFDRGSYMWFYVGVPRWGDFEKGTVIFDHLEDRKWVISKKHADWIGWKYLSDNHVHLNRPSLFIDDLQKKIVDEVVNLMEEIKMAWVVSQKQN